MSVNAQKICGQAFNVVKQFISKEPETIIGIQKTEEGWHVRVEALERKAVPDTQDLLGSYELKFDNEGELLGWTQVMIRKRSDRMVPEEEEWIVSG